MENSNSINIGTKMCGANLHFLDVKKKTITALSSTLSHPAGYCKCKVRILWYFVPLCLLYFSFQATKKLKGESRYVERWLRQREAISHSATACCSTSVTNSRAECLLSVNESLIRCTMEMGRRVCGPCCFLHQCPALSQAAPHEPTLIFGDRSLKEHKPETFITASWIALWWTFVKTAVLKVT